MDSKKIQMPREVHIGADVIDNTGSICKDLRFYGEVLVVTGPNTLKIGGADKAIESLENEDFEVDLSKINDATSKTVKK